MCALTAPFPICYQDYMTRKNDTMIPDLLADPFGERSQMIVRKHIQLLGGRFQFESNSHELLQLVDSAYLGLPRHRLSDVSPRMRVQLLLSPGVQPRRRRRSEPPPLSMLSVPGYLGGATDSSNFVVLSPTERTALVVLSRQMLRFPYHARYEFIEFAVFTLAARCQGMVSLHAACVGRAGRGVLLMGPSGSGKSTVALHCLLEGFDMLSEDSVFVAPETMLATGVANFLHVRSDSLRWVARTRDAVAIRKSPVIRRRSGVKKFEVDLRCAAYRLAPAPLKIVATVFLSARGAGNRPLLRPLSKPALLAKLTAAQAYAANQPEWTMFRKNISRLGAFELRRGNHPLEAVEALKALLESPPRLA
jgi:energy-coupling factor transporter ATP-binding protein EcfA2